MNEGGGFEFKVDIKVGLPDFEGLGMEALLELVPGAVSRGSPRGGGGLGFGGYDQVSCPGHCAPGGRWHRSPPHLTIGLPHTYTQHLRATGTCACGTITC